MDERFERKMISKSRRSRILQRMWSLALLAALVFGQLGILPAQVQVAQAATNHLTLNVVSARAESRAFGGAGVVKGAPVTEYKYIINIDNTGVTSQKPNPATGALPLECTPADPSYPANCLWTSVAGVPGSSPIYTQGDQSDFVAGIDLPDGRYLISVLADGYKLDGAHFSVPLADPGVVTVELQPWPVPEATIRAQIFEDLSPTNSAPDLPTEHGLAGFVGHINDYLGEVTTDVYGNPLCTVYEGEDPVTHTIDPAYLSPPDYAPTPVPGTGGQCVSDSDGMLAIPHVGPNRYALSAIPPDGSHWIQTTTLEGNHDWDAWVMEGATGYDTEFVNAGEQFPAIFFGFVPAPTSGAIWTNPNLNHPASAGQVKGVVAALKAYIPGVGGQTGLDGLQGARFDRPLGDAWVALSDLQQGDTALYVARVNPDGSFTLPNVPNGSYTLAYWDEPQDYILSLINVTINHGETVDLGVIGLPGWWTDVDGYVFNDLNRNGVKDAGEPGIPGFPVAMKKRENSLMDRGAVLVTTDASGHYRMENMYPMTQWLVMEAYSDSYYTTGVTYQADNQPTPTTVVGAGVDVSVLPIIGLGGRLDWGVHAYDPTGTNGVDPQNGGIVGTVSYDTTRNELDPRFAAVEDWQPGISNLNVNLYAPVDCGTDPNAPCDETGRYELNPDGSYRHGSLLNTYLTETWERPTACVARDVNGDPLTYPGGQQALPQNPNAECLEAPMMGVQFQTGFSTVDGNYGFGAGCFGPGGASEADTCADGSDPTPLPAGDYLVQVEMQNDGLGRPLYKVTREEDINIFNGDQFVPQVPPPACAGPLHIVDVADSGGDNYPTLVGDGGVTNDLPVGVSVPASEPTANPGLADGGGSPFEGQARPLCDTKLVPLSNGRSIAPTFNYFTDVPLPGRFWGLLVDDLNFSSDPRSLLYGEKAGVPFAPVGIYDWTNRLVATTESDFNGLWDVLLPSTNRINCPTPSGVCANLYRFVGNDPGIPGHLNTNFNPQFRTIAAEFEALPGLIVPADLAPTQMGAAVQLPGGQFNQTAVCSVDTSTPQLFTVSSPYADFRSSATPVSITITGLGFGATQGSGQITLDGTPLTAAGWSDRQITFSATNSLPPGPHQLAVKAGNGRSSTNGLTFHVLSGGFPTTTILDNFNRANGGLGANWVSGTATGRYRIFNNAARVVQSDSNPNPWIAAGNSNFGANQEAYFTVTRVSTAATEQAVFMKFPGTGSDPRASAATWIEVTYNPGSATLAIRTKGSGTNNIVTRATFGGVSFAAGDQLGARTFADGTVQAYKNGVKIGSVNVTTGPNPWPASLASGGGRIGVWFTGATATNYAEFDNFGGGNGPASSYTPNLYEVGPNVSNPRYRIGDFDANNPPHAIQNALDDAAASPNDDLVVVYPNIPQGDRINPRGAYFENLIITAPVKLQGVGPGGVYPDGAVVTGTVLDGSAYAGDSALADAWRARVNGLTWIGNQTVSEGETIYLLAQNQNQFSSGFKTAIDGFDLRGGDQMGQANIITQGGAIFANAYIRSLQITNNIVEANTASYGVIRIGTPDLPAPDTSQHNEDLRIANNRILANSGTNLAGAIGLFAGADRYEIAGNDLCGNFSAEYGGAISHYGYSPNGKIHDNRIALNQSYDEGGGIMIAGTLPANPLALSQGAGAVDIYNNTIQGNLANDDGGGLRFLMAGNFPMNVYNNLIVNNVSTHEGGGVSLNDAPNVRFFNNTVMKNITTATAITSDGQPAPAGLSSSANSNPLQATLPGGSPLFSNPLLFNNIFWDNRAGTRGTLAVTGIGAAGDASPIYHWDLGVADGAGLLSPTNSVLQVATGTNPSATNRFTDPLAASPIDLALTFQVWRGNPNFIGAIMVTLNLPPTLLGNYHLLNATSSAYNGGAASVIVPIYQRPPNNLLAPATDIDGQARPAGGAMDIGADEYLP